MTDRETTFAAAIANPECDTTRLAHADAVQESGDEELAALIRVGVLCGCVFNKQPTVDAMGCGPCEGRQWMRRCEHEGCRQPGRECTLEGISGGERDDVIEFFCGQHAPLNGYCSVCGSYWGGIDSFENSGVCDHCADQLEADDAAEDDWFDYPGRYYPDE